MSIYRNIFTNECAKLIKDDEKYKTVMLQTEQDKTISLSYSTFHKNWKQLNNDSVNWKQITNDNVVKSV